jgi:hypothetical protein
MPRIWFTLVDKPEIQRPFHRNPVAPDIYRLADSTIPHGFHIKSTGEVFDCFELINEAVGSVVYIYDLKNKRRVGRLGHVLIHESDPVHIRFKKLNGDVVDEGWSGNTTNPLQIKRDLAHALSAPLVDESYGSGEDIDGRLRHAGIDPDTIEIYRLPFTPINLP